jgi:hypothetical protein
MRAVVPTAVRPIRADPVHASPQLATGSPASDILLHNGYLQPSDGGLGHVCQTGSARNHPWEVSVLFLPLSGCNCVLTNIDRVLRFCAISPLCSVRRLAIVTHPVMPLTDLWFETPASVRDDSVLRAASAAVLHVARPAATSRHGRSRAARMPHIHALAATSASLSRPPDSARQA